jgi:hypothetical protein
MIVLQIPESLECCAVPFGQVGRGFIGCLKEIEKNIVRCFGIADFVVGKNKLPKIAAVERGRRSDRNFGETFRLRIGIGVERGIVDRAAAGPEAAAADLVRISFVRDSIRKIGNARDRKLCVWVLTLTFLSDLANHSPEHPHHLAAAILPIPPGQ